MKLANKVLNMHEDKTKYILKLVKGDSKVRAFGKEHKVNNLSGDFAIFAVGESELLGWLLITNENKNTISPLDVKVREKYRREGIASSMYAFAEKKIKKKFVRAAIQSHDAEALWDQENRKFGKES